MILRFRILSPGNSGAPDYNICGQAATVVDFTNLSAELKVDGESIWSTNNLAAFVFPAPVVTTANGYTVGSAFEDVDWIKTDISLPEIWMSTSVELIISKAGYITYSNVFTVFGYDLGNNPNQNNSLGNPITGNPDMDIRLINETNNVVNGLQTKAYSSFTGYYKPFTNALYLYKLDSGGYEVTYKNSDGNVIASTRNAVVCLNGDTVTQTTRIYENDSNCGCGTQEVLSECVSSPQTFSHTRETPRIGVTVNCTDCIDSDCVSQLNTQQAYPSVDWMNLQNYWVDDEQQLPFGGDPDVGASLVIDYYLYNSDGQLLGTAQYTLTGLLPTSVFDPTLYPFTPLPIPDIGDYVVVMKVSHIYNYPTGGSFTVFTCTAKTPVHVCHWYEIKKQECNKYRVYNHSFQTRTVVVSKLTELDTFTQVSSNDIESGQYKDIVLSDGVYKFELTLPDGSTFIYVVIVYCKLQQCFLDYLNGIICCNCNSKCEDTCQKYYDFNTFVVQLHTFFSMLNSEYNFFFIYDALLPNKIAQLYEISLFIDRIDEYCGKCKEGCDKCGGDKDFKKSHKKGSKKHYNNRHKDSDCGCS